MCVLLTVRVKTRIEPGSVGQARRLVAGSPQVPAVVLVAVGFHDAAVGRGIALDVTLWAIIDWASISIISTAGDTYAFFSIVSYLLF